MIIKTDELGIRFKKSTPYFLYSHMEWIPVNGTRILRIELIAADLLSALIWGAQGGASGRRKALRL